MERIKNKEIAEMEAKRLAREAREKAFRDRVDLLINKFKGHIYKLMLPGLFFKGLRDVKTIERKKKLKEHEDTFYPIQDSITNTIKIVMARALREFWETETSLHIIVSTGKEKLYQERVPGDSERKRRAKILIDTMMGVLEELLSPRFKDRLKDYMLNFIGSYFGPGSHLKSEFHMPYELDRLEFDSFGALL